MEKVSHFSKAITNEIYGTVEVVGKVVIYE